LEQTNEGLWYKAPKTRAGRREIAIPPSVVVEIRAQRRRQQEQRLAPAMGSASGEDLIFGRQDGKLWAADSLTIDWVHTIRRSKLPVVTLHALRHAHVSQLIASGPEVVTVSHRIGPSNPTVTLNVYSRLFGNTDERASNAVETGLAGLLTE
jgi:integrase